MYKNVLQSIEHVAIWPVISFVIFFLFFLCLLWWVFTTDSKFIDKMKQLPIDDGQDGKNAQLGNPHPATTMKEN